MNKTKRKLISYLLDYVESSVEHPTIVLETLAKYINAEVESNHLGLFQIKRKDKVIFSGYFRNVLEDLTLYLLENL